MLFFLYIAKVNFNTMAQQTDIIKAEVAGLYANGARLAHITNVTINFNNDVQEVVSNTTVKSYIYGRDSWTASADGLVSFNTGYNWDYLMSMLDQYQVLTIKVPTNSSGSDFLQGNVLLQSQTLTAGNTGSMIQMSLQFVGSGPLQRVFSAYPLAGTNPQATVDGAACATAYPATYYAGSQSNYPKLGVGDILYTDVALTTPVTGQANNYIGIINAYGEAYRLDAAGAVTVITVSTCDTGTGF